ncbi:MAG: MBL fold metallo-hydrolase [Eubacteriales bacterium]|nr:MBL fold metallo-hydrolase [Eubacteriales bacterium]
MAILYKVQTGAYKSAVRATVAAAGMRNALKKAGIKDVSVAVINSGGYYKVQEGAFASKANAERRRDLIRSAGIYAVVLETKTQDPEEISPDTTPAEDSQEAPAAKPHRIRVAALAFFDNGTGAFGDCTALIEYGDDDKTVAHAVLIDTAQSKSAANVIKKLKALGVKRLDAIIISHAHGDHYGGTTSIIKAFPTADIYVPDPTELDKYQKSYGNNLRNQYKKAKGHYLKRGTTFAIGNMIISCAYICPASALKEHDSHHFVNNQSAVMRINLNGWIYHTAGDLQNEANRVLINAVKNLKADIFKCQWHGDANACSEAICRAVKPLVAFSNYNRKEHSGRDRTRKRLEAVGSVVARNYENGDIYIDCLPDTMKLSCSKKNLSKLFRR